MSRRRGFGPPDTERLYSLKVDNITYKTTVESLRRAFEKYGEIGDVYIPRDRYTQESRGFGFVRFYDERDADDAIDSMDGKMFDGRELRVQMAKHPRPSFGYYGRSGGGGRSYRGSRYSRSRSRSRSRRRRSYSRSRSRSRNHRRSRDRYSRRSRSRSYSRGRSSSYKKDRSRSRDRKDSRSVSRDNKKEDSRDRHDDSYDNKEAINEEKRDASVEKNEEHNEMESQNDEAGVTENGNDENNDDADN